ncbi:hypothetical protein V1477_002476 [Vespula maculifrons]|uniref:Uncharacterized protein n=1 Tax=Vespula maculifrons TaxID=7453 RepID=A0ABD2CWY8_VESMC
MSRGKLLKPILSSQKSKCFKSKMVFTDVTGISVRLLTLLRIEQLNRLSRDRCNSPEPRKRNTINFNKEIGQNNSCLDDRNVRAKLCFINEWSRLITSREFHQNELIPSPTFNIF